MRAQGVDIRPLRQMTGGTCFNEVFFDDVWVPDDDRLGDVGEGWRVAMTTLTNERGAIGGSGFGGRAILSLDRLRAMVQHFGCSDDPVVRQRVAALVCGLRTATWTRQRFADNRSTGAELPILKLSLCRDFSRLAELVADILGTRLVADTGEWGSYAWSAFVLGVPGYRLGGGTDEILKSLIGERVLGLPKM
jgi:alkylation response protein AidB-like acyl-CoA dehydrogenase